MRYILITALLFVTGCATQQRFREHCDAWIGKTGDELVMKLGVPHSMMTLDSGGKLYQYSARSVSHETTYNKYSRSISTDENVYSCEVTYVANAKNIITTYSYRGNACRSW